KTARASFSIRCTSVGCPLSSRARFTTRNNPSSPASADCTRRCGAKMAARCSRRKRSEEHTSELQSRFDLVCRLLLEKKKNENNYRVLAPVVDCHLIGCRLVIEHYRDGYSTLALNLRLNPDVVHIVRQLPRTVVFVRL